MNDENIKSDQNRVTSDECREPDDQQTDRAARGPYLDEVRGPSGHRRKGKVARLPKPIREQINEWIEENLTYAEIVEKLRTEDDIEVSISNVSQWEKGGYRDWCKERERQALLQGSFDKVFDLLAKAEPEDVPDLIVKVMAARVGGVLSDLSPSELRENSDKDPRNLVRLLSLVPKLSREALRTRKYRRSVEREEAQELKERDPSKPFGDDSDHRAVVDIVDKVLGLRKYRRDRVEETETRTSNIQLPSGTSAAQSNIERNTQAEDHGKWNPNVGLAAENGKGENETSNTEH